MILILLFGCCINILINALIALITYTLSLDAFVPFVAIICYMYSFIFVYLVSSFISAMCCDLMSIVQVAFDNPLINELLLLLLPLISAVSTMSLAM